MVHLPQHGTIGFDPQPFGCFQATPAGKLSSRTSLLGGVVLQLPHTLPLGELFLEGPDLGQNAHLEAAHVEQDVRVVLAKSGFTEVTSSNCSL